MLQEINKMFEKNHIEEDEKALSMFDKQVDHLI